MAVSDECSVPANAPHITSQVMPPEQTFPQYKPWLFSLYGHSLPSGARPTAYLNHEGPFHQSCGVAKFTAFPFLKLCPQYLNPRLHASSCYFCSFLYFGYPLSNKSCPRYSDCVICPICSLLICNAFCTWLTCVKIATQHK